MIRAKTVALLFFVFAWVTVAAERPDYSGRWRMVKEQSDFGQFVAPDMVVRVVEEHGSTMNVHTVQTRDKKTSYSDVSYFTTGEISTNSMSGRDATSKAFWDGDTLVIRTDTKDSKGQDEHIVDRWDLSPDRQMLTISSHIETVAGEADLKLVCRKEAVQKADR